MLAFTPHPCLSAFLALAALAFPAPHAQEAPSAVRPSAAKADAAQFPVHEWVELVKVVDGDTLQVRRAGAIAKLRLLCVDTEERFHPGQSSSGSKPQTVFGEETALWAEAFFAGLAHEGEALRVGLCFPHDREQLDAYGRLLAHVVLPDGRDYELELVRSGRSPYFNKYGDSEVAHGAFVEAQAQAQRRKLGIWNPATNEPATPGVPAVKRPYARLLPWWNARAAALADFARRRAAGTDAPLEFADLDALEKHVGSEVELFGEFSGKPREWHGALEYEVFGSQRGQPLRLVVPESAREALSAARIGDFGREYHQNYFYARGKLERAGRGFEVRLERPDQIRRAGPEPVAPR
ncbi:MAG: thermonuclease family protein [Planctomycetes bacterium]|nr:thermonuclease family protein [Planctomycetota bacterium]